MYRVCALAVYSALCWLSVSFGARHCIPIGSHALSSDLSRVCARQAIARGGNRQDRRHLFLSSNGGLQEWSTSTQRCDAVITGFSQRVRRAQIAKKAMGTRSDVQSVRITRPRSTHACEFIARRAHCGSAGTVGRSRRGHGRRNVGILCHASTLQNRRASANRCPGQLEETSLCTLRQNRRRPHLQRVPNGVVLLDLLSKKFVGNSQDVVLSAVASQETLQLTDD